MINREINIINRIHHSNIVKLFCIIETDRQIFIILKLITLKKMKTTAIKLLLKERKFIRK